MLTRYLEGELSVEETQQLEQVMAEDPFMADALEGLRSMPDPTRAHAIGQELKFNAHKLLREKRPVLSLFQFNQYATAAVAVLVILFVATAAILLTSRMQEKPADVEAKVFTEHLEQKAEASESPDEPVSETEAVPVSPAEELPKEQAKDEIKSAPSREIADNSRPQAKPEASRPVADPSPSTMEKDADLVEDEENRIDQDIIIAEEEAAEAKEQQAGAANETPVTVQAYDQIPAEPTLTQEQLEPYKQALTEGEYEAYQTALSKLEKSLAPANTLTGVVAGVRTQNEEISSRKTRERERKARRKEEREARASEISKQAEKVDAFAENDDRVDRDRKNQETTFDSNSDDFEVNENLLKQQLYTDPTNGENWLKLGKYYVEHRQFLKAEPYLKGAARSGKLSVVQEANRLLKQIEK